MLQVNVNRRSYKFNVRIYKIYDDRYNVVNLITMHVLIIFRSSCMFNISRYVHFNKYGDCCICYM